MKKTISRDLVFTAAEVREAILRMLRERDQPVPGDKADVEFKLSGAGASLAWTEIFDDEH